MKNKFKTVIIISVILLSSCTKTTDDLVKDAFKDYVSKNFDDPSKLENIISITINDTISSQKIICFANNLIEAYDKELDKIHNLRDSLSKAQEILFNKIRNDNNLSRKFKGDKTGFNLISESLVTLNDIYKYETSSEPKQLDFNRKTLENSLKVLQSDTIFIISYEINTRLKTDRGLKIKKYYAQFKGEESIYIFDNDNIYNLPKSINKVCNDIDTYTASFKMMADLYFKDIDAQIRSCNYLSKTISYYEKSN